MNLKRALVDPAQNIERANLHFLLKYVSLSSLLFHAELHKVTFFASLSLNVHVVASCECVAFFFAFGFSLLDRAKVCVA